MGPGTPHEIWQAVPEASEFAAAETGTADSCEPLANAALVVEVAEAETGDSLV